MKKNKFLLTLVPLLVLTGCTSSIDPSSSSSTGSSVDPSTVQPTTDSSNTSSTPSTPTTEGGGDIEVNENLFRAYVSSAVGGAWVFVTIEWDDGYALSESNIDMSSATLNLANGSTQESKGRIDACTTSGNSIKFGLGFNDASFQNNSVNTFSIKVTYNSIVYLVVEEFIGVFSTSDVTFEVVSQRCSIYDAGNPGGGDPITPPDIEDGECPIEGYNIVFSDEFNGTSLNTSIWNYDIGTGSSNGLTYWGNGEEEYYLQDNVAVTGGNLVITAKKQNYGDRAYTSGRINTKSKVKYTYGYFEAKMKLPEGIGMWPAFWLLPDNSPYGGWAGSGEIDIMEARGREIDRIDQTIHYGSTWPNNRSSGTSYALPNNGKITEFHKYGLEWTESYLAYYVDGKMTYKVYNTTYFSTEAPDNPSAPFDVDFHIIFDLAVGGAYDGYNKPDASFVSSEMLVDYVRVYQK